jgi:hypothetical protein
VANISDLAQAMEYSKESVRLFETLLRLRVQRIGPTSFESAFGGEIQQSDIERSMNLPSKEREKKLAVESIDAFIDSLD